MNGAQGLGAQRHGAGRVAVRGKQHVRVRPHAVAHDDRVPRMSLGGRDREFRGGIDKDVGGPR